MLSKHLLLQVATPEAIVRLQCSALAADRKKVESIYFQQQGHNSVLSLLKHYVTDSKWEAGALMQVLYVCGQNRST